MRCENKSSTWFRSNAKRPSRSRLETIATHLAVAITTSALWAYYFRVWGQYYLELPTSRATRTYNSTLVTGANYYHCGDSIESAKAHGCIYDILDNHWIPSQCMDQASIEEYQSDDSWHGYADANHTQPLSIEAMGDTPMYWTNERDHIVHCAMLWRKQFRALFEKRPYLDSLVVDEEHTIHCSKYLIEMSEKGTDFRQIPLKVFVGFAGCHVRE